MGSSGWSYGKISKLKSLEYIGRILNAVEVNTSFYGRLARWGKYAKKWGVRVKDDFHFALKVYREVTHDSRFKPLESRKSLSRDKMSLYEEMIKGCSLIGPKARLLLFQLPPSFKYNEENTAVIEDFFENVERNEGIDLAIEFRSPEWFAEENVSTIEDLLHRLDLIYVIVSSPMSHLEPLVVSKNNIAYLRLHGFTRWYATDYLIERSPREPDKPAIFDVLHAMTELERKGARRIYVFWDNTDILTPEGIYYYPHLGHALALHYIWSGDEIHRENLKDLEEIIARYYTKEINQNTSRAIEKDLKALDDLAGIFNKTRERLSRRSVTSNISQ